MKKFLWIILSSFIVALLALGMIMYYFFGDWLKTIREFPTNPPPITQDEGNVPSSNDILPPENLTNLDLKLPPGFSISYFAQNLGAPRVMIQDPNGILITSITRNGRVVALPDKDQDGKADEAITLLEKLNNPHGLAFRCKETCQLYIAETHEVNRYDYDPETYALSNKTFVVDFQKDSGRHFTRTLLYLPDEDRILISVGSSCDVCHEKDWRPGKVLSAYFDGAEYKEFATGLRNSVFMKVHPVTGEVWATEMGRDWLGDDIPPDEVNILREGKNYGWPVCFGKNIHDTSFDKNTYIRNPCMEPFEEPSYIDLQAHSAPLGLDFFPDNWPEEYRHDLLVAYHGSWNRTEPTGYKIVRYELNDQGEVIGSEQEFLGGWINDENDVVGRPADILMTDQKTIFISDDKGGSIYMIKYLEQ
jgi:glucose/arabinose dehydrogenase